MTEKKNISKGDRCSVALRIGYDIMFSECLPEGKDLVGREIAELLGLDGKEINPISEHCKSVLDKGLTEDVCRDFRGIRRWVLCRTWQLMDEEKKRFRDAISQAWKEAKDICAEKGVYV